jgi:hypothetical protein
MSGIDQRDGLLELSAYDLTAGATRIGSVECEVKIVQQRRFGSETAA